ncbi:transposon Ty3-I Gag-Pol polyprotein [Trichonephila clavipes]|uniref:Transposon Ty3-I Gag-Pol polyprotein n=1 Tax=Trichonephila clavipes TaxID=2585209 RepID=A0A8X6VFG2_TRICX|nr:transposon Ty3-I Gag-Pol polyprotein [Trichonephila clavipes]
MDKLRSGLLTSSLLLLKGDAKFHWGPEEREYFETLKRALNSEPVLGMYDENSPTDVGGYGIGSVLAQIQNKIEKVLAYASKTLTIAGKNYSTAERECLGIEWTINKFWPNLFRKHFTIVTDHHSLCWLMCLKDYSER